MDPDALAEQNSGPMKLAPMDSWTQGVTNLWPTSGRAAFCHRTPADSIHVYQDKPGPLLQCNINNRKHQILPHGHWCNIQVGAHGHLMHFHQLDIFPSLMWLLIFQHHAAENHIT